MSDPLTDLLGGTLTSLEVEIAMADIATLCMRAEAGDGEAAAREFLEQNGISPTTITLTEYAELKEEDILSFYKKNRAVKIVGRWGAFWISPDLTPIPDDPAPVITPIGLYAFACHLKSQLPEQVEEGY